MHRIERRRAKIGGFSSEDLDAILSGLPGQNSLTKRRREWLQIGLNWEWTLYSARARGLLPPAKAGKALRAEKRRAEKLLDALNDGMANLLLTDQPSGFSSAALQKRAAVAAPPAVDGSGLNWLKPPVFKTQRGGYVALRAGLRWFINECDCAVRRSQTLSPITDTKLRLRFVIGLSELYEETFRRTPAATRGNHWLSFLGAVLAEIEGRQESIDAFAIWHEARKFSSSTKVGKSDKKK